MLPEDQRVSGGDLSRRPAHESPAYHRGWTDPVQAQPRIPRPAPLDGMVSTWEDGAVIDLRGLGRRGACRAQARDREAKDRGGGHVTRPGWSFSGGQIDAARPGFILTGGHLTLHPTTGRTLTGKAQRRGTAAGKKAPDNPELGRGNAEFGTGFAPLVRWVPQSPWPLPLYAIPQSSLHHPTRGGAYPRGVVCRLTVGRSCV
jgi:hypothetical protein